MLHCLAPVQVAAGLASLHAAGVVHGNLHGGWCAPCSVPDACACQQPSEQPARSQLQPCSSWCLALRRGAEQPRLCVCMLLAERLHVSAAGFLLCRACSAVHMYMPLTLEPVVCSVWLERARSSRGYTSKLACAGLSWPQNVLPADPPPNAWVAPESRRTVGPPCLHRATPVLCVLQAPCALHSGPQSATAPDNNQRAGWHVVISLSLQSAARS